MFSFFPPDFSDSSDNDEEPTRKCSKLLKRTFHIDNNLHSNDNHHHGNDNHHLSNGASARRKRNALSARERNLRRLESNERERMRMHSLNDAFEVSFADKNRVPPPPNIRLFPCVSDFFGHKVIEVNFDTSYTLEAFEKKAF